jgi:hypothetical protein
MLRPRSRQTQVKVRVPSRRQWSDQPKQDAADGDVVQERCSQLVLFVLYDLCRYDHRPFSSVAKGGSNYAIAY